MGRHPIPWIPFLLFVACLSTACGSHPPRVAPGVTLEGRPIGGMTEDELRLELQVMAPRLAMPPKEPYVDPETGGLIPGLDGWRLDVEMTLKDALSAPQGISLAYRFSPWPPQKALRDLPPAPIYRGNPEKEAMAFLINVAWGNEWIPDLLSLLQEEKASATWFLLGRWVERYPDLARSIRDAGQEIASHGYRDGDWETYTTDEIRKDIQMADEAIEKATGVKPVWFSTHRGIVNEAIVTIARELGHETILWSADTADWMDLSVEAMVARVEKRLQPGVLILMHPTPKTAAAAREILRLGKERGLTLLPLGELLSSRRLEGPPPGEWP
ncbi:MAG: polysaccharide deacetylase family protein [Clostridiales bacterium]|nr:polysaccharide deacetylase family protein [Clostridiales bacterium]